MQLTVQCTCYKVLTFTKAECRYMLCGIITAPTIPTAWQRINMINKKKLLKINYYNLIII